MIRNLAVAVLFSMIFCSCSSRKSERNDVMEKAAPASAAPDPRPVIVAFGDSLTAGAGVPEDGNYPAKLQKKIEASGYRYRVVNAGISGETSSQGLDRVQTIAALHPAIAIVEFGANDGLRGMPAETIDRNIAGIVRTLQSSGAKVVLSGMQIPPNYGPQYTAAFRNVFPRVARQYNVTLIPFFLEGVGGRAELNQDDGIHPTSEGYDVVVDNIWRVLKPLL